MRHPEDIANVLLPTLRGEFCLVVLGKNGYNGAVLARTERGLLHGAKRRIFGGDTNVEFGPTRIKIVAPCEATIARIAAEHAREAHERRLRAHRQAVYDYFRAFGVLPRGYVLTRKNARGGFHVSTPDHEDKTAKWVGAGAELDAYAVPFTPEYDTSPGEPSHAEVATPTHVAFRGWSGGMGEKFKVDTLPHHALASEEPAFYFTIVEQLPTALEATFAAYAEAKAQKAKQREAWEDEAMRRSEEQAAAERAGLVGIFGAPEVAK